MSTWIEVRPAWIKRVNAKALLSVIAEVAAENEKESVSLGEQAQILETILWLSTRGERGKEWGQAGVPVMRFLDDRDRNRLS